MVHTVFFGTHTLATTILQGLIDAPDITVDLVITQPDRPVGRKKILTPPPVKVLASNHGIQVLQPESLKDLAIETCTSYEVGTLAEYGLMVPDTILQAFPKGIVNVHPSLLPLYRGATPIQSAIQNGDTTTGVSLMLLEKTMDTGPILAQSQYEITPHALYPAVQYELAKIGASMLVDTLPKYLSGDITPSPQDDAQATYCSQLSRQDGKVDWNASSHAIYNQYRAFTPWPGVFTFWNNKRLKLLTIQPSKRSLPPGQVEIYDTSLFVGSGDGSIEIVELQLEGKKPMDAKTFSKGFGNIDGEVLGI